MSTYREVINSLKLALVVSIGKGVIRMLPESQFQHIIQPKKKSGRKKLRKNYDVIVLRDATAEGIYPKGSGFRKRTRLRQRRSPLRGDNIYRTQNAVEDTLYWYRVKGA